MALELKNLDDVTRQYMVSEIQDDTANGLVYHSKYLTHEGRQQWEHVLLEAAQHYDSVWLAEQLRNEALAVPVIITRGRNGVIKQTRFEAESLADSEFNRYYIRGLCLRAIHENREHVVTYRAKAVGQAKSRVGVKIDPKCLLEDLRTHKLRTEYGVPSNPNSGISVTFL